MRMAVTVGVTTIRPAMPGWFHPAGDRTRDPKPGEHVRVILRDGSTTIGTFMETDCWILTGHDETLKNDDILLWHYR